MAVTSGIEVAPRFPVLDALRALGAFAVLTTHVAFYAGTYTDHGTWGAFLSRLDVGVAIFFVLSGFLLSRPHLARAALNLDRPAVGVYYWHRVLRIYPVYALTVVLALLLLEDNAQFGLRDWLITLGLSNTATDSFPPSGLSQMWSLAVEVCFYLTLPLLMRAATSRHRLQRWRVLAVAGMMAAISVWWHLDGAPRSESLNGGSPLQWLPAYLGWFAAGIVLALTHVVSTSNNNAGHTGIGRRLSNRVLELGREPGVCWTLVAALMLVATTSLAGPIVLEPASPAESLTKNLIYATVGALIVLTGIAAEPGSAYTRLLDNAPARHLGITSYSFFCLHLLVLDLLAPAVGFPLFGGHFLALWLLTAVVSVVVAETSYRLLERPVLRLKNIRPFRRPRSITGNATNGTKAK